MKSKKEEGAILILVVLLLPLLVVVAGLVADMGILLYVRHLAYAAADLGALAGAQNVDLERLAGGERWIEEGPARRDAEAWARNNLEVNFPGRGVESRAEVRVEVYNPIPAHYPGDRYTGRVLRDPTVCVLINLPVRLRFLSMLVPEVNLTVHADASVVERKGGRPGTP